MASGTEHTDRPIRLFLSWAHANEVLKDDFISRLTPRLKILTGVTFEWWEDSHLWLGEEWRRGILDRIDECDYALQLLSPEFLASDFNAKYEIPPFVGPQPRKACLPVGLSPVKFDGSQNLRGIDALQVFRLNGKFYSQVGRHKRDDFASTLASEIQRRISGGSQWRAI